jgi:hypothetical protein
LYQVGPQLLITFSLHISTILILQGWQSSEPILHYFCLHELSMMKDHCNADAVSN